MYSGQSGSDEYFFPFVFLGGWTGGKEQSWGVTGRSQAPAAMSNFTGGSPGRTGSDEYFYGGSPRANRQRDVTGRSPGRTGSEEYFLPIVFLTPRANRRRRVFFTDPIPSGCSYSFTVRCFFLDPPGRTGGEEYFLPIRSRQDVTYFLPFVFFWGDPPGRTGGEEYFLPIRSRQDVTCSRSRRQVLGDHPGLDRYDLRRTDPICYRSDRLSGRISD